MKDWYPHLVPGSEEPRIIIKGLPYETAESVEEFQQPLHILL